MNNAFSVVIYYQHEDYYMFFLLASYNSDKITPPSSEKDFLRGLSRMDEMYYFETEHVYVKELNLCENNGIRCLASPVDSEMEKWEMLEIDKCLGIYQVQNNVLSLIYNDIGEAFKNGLRQWQPMYLGILER